MLIFRKIKDKLLGNREKKELDDLIFNSFFDMDVLNKVNNVLTTSKTIYQKEQCYNIIKQYKINGGLTKETQDILNGYLTVLNFEIKYYYFTLEEMGKQNE